MLRFAVVGAVAFAFPCGAGAGEPAAPSFGTEIVPLLTKMGCNAGACHGKGAGQNGFRLSLRGYAPEMDHLWLTREYDGRRIDTTTPENSLLLLKPLGKAPHEGGKLFSEGGREYQLLLDWVRAGAPGPRKDEPDVKRVYAEPAQRTLAPGQEL